MASLTGQFVRFMLVVAVALVTTLQGVLAAPYAAIVMDARTGETLYARNADTRLHPASLTKMLTLYIAFDAIQRGEISLDTMVKVSKNAAAQPPSRLGLKAGQRIALRHLIRAAAVKSANDAASAIGDHLGGDEARFAARMNRMARALGMKNSSFKNANGLTAPGHLSTARDMNTLGRRLFYDFPQYYNIFSRRSTDAGIATVANTNRRFLDAYPGADGIKTGYTVPAGFNLTGSAERGSVRIIATVFGGTSTAQRNAKMAELLDIGFRNAPANVAVRKPKPPVHADPEDAAVQPPELLADADAGSSRASGKTIRLVMTMKSSPRPLARPDPRLAMAAEEAVSGLQGAIDAALAQASETLAEPAAIASALPIPRPETSVPPEILPFALVEDAAVPARAAQPERATESAVSEPAQPDPALAAAIRSAAGSVATEATDAEPAGTASAAAEPATLGPSDALPFEVVDAPAAAPPGIAATGEMMPFEVVAGLPEQAAGGERPRIDASAGEHADLALLSLPPPDRPSVPVARVAIAPEPPPPVRAPEVIVRISTSGARHWGVSLGRYPSRAVAERVLMRTGLSEAAALGDGLRKIVQRGGGFDATFAGLTQEQADLACRRIQARAQACDTIGP